MSSNHSASTHCPSCGKPLRVPNTMRGFEVVCPHEGCGVSFVVPGAPEITLPDGRPASVSQQTVPEEEAAVEEEAEYSRPDRERSSNLIYYAMAGLLIVGVAAIVVLQPDKETPDALAQLPPPPPVVAPQPVTKPPPPTQPPHVVKPPVRPKPGTLSDEERAKLNARYAQADQEASRKREETLRNLMDKANAGDAEAQTQLGRMYQLGAEVAPDNEKARVWYAKAGALGHVGALQALGDVEMAVGRKEQAGAAYLSAGRHSLAGASRSDQTAVRNLNAAMYLLALHRLDGPYQELSAEIQKARPSVLAQATGTFAGPSHVLAVAEAFKGYNPSTHRLFIQSKSVPKTEVSVKSPPGSEGLCILELPAAVPSVSGIAVGSVPGEGEGIWVGGFPHPGFMGAAASAELAKAGGHSDKPGWVAVAAMQPGHRGGPVVNAKGELVGIVLSRRDGNGGGCLCVGPDAIRPVLERIPGATPGARLSNDPALNDAVASRCVMIWMEKR